MKLIVQNLATNYLSEGKGKTILILHGWGDSINSFTNVVRLLSKNYNVVALDLPGFGGTEIPKSDWCILDYANFVKDFCNKLDIKPTYIIGHSMGGRVLIKLASKKLLNPEKIVLLSSAGIKESAKGKNLIIKLFSKPGKVLINSRILGRQGGSLRQKIYKKFGSEDYISSGQLKKTFINIINEDLVGDAINIKIPTLLIYGENDDQTPPLYGSKFNKAIDGSKLKIIAGRGHFIQLEDPIGLSDIMMDFFK